MFPKEEKTSIANKASAITHISESYSKHVENMNTNIC